MSDDGPTVDPAILRRRAIITIVASVVGVGLIVIGVVLASTGPGESGIDAELEGVSEVEVAEDVSDSTSEAAADDDDEDEPERFGPSVAAPRCWPAFGRTPSRTSGAASMRLNRPGKLVWRRAMGGLLEFPATGCDGVLYANNAKGFTIAVEAETGRELWRRRTGDVYDSSPAIWQDRLLLGAKMGEDKAATEGGRISAVRRTNGSKIWTINLDTPVESSPVVVDGTAYVAAQDGRVYSINPRSGRIKWAYRTGGRINGSPAVVNGRVFVANYSGRVTAVSTDGKRIWERTIWLVNRVKPERFYSSVVVANGRAIVSGVGGYVYAFSASNGTQLWRYNVQGGGAQEYVYATPAVAGGRVVVGAYDGRVRALRAKDGSEIWSSSVGGRVSGSGVIIGSNAYVSTLEGSTYGFNVETGKRVWTHRKGKYVPGIALGNRFYMSLNGVLAAFEPARRS